MLVSKGEKMGNLRKTLSVVIKIICIVTIIIILFFIYTLIVKNNVPQYAVDVFYENTEKLNEFAKLCLKNGILSIDSVEHSSIAKYSYNIAGYHIYASQEMAEATQFQFEESLHYLKKMHISDIYTNIEKEKVSFVITRYLTGATLIYMNEHISLEELAEDIKSIKVQYLDEHWAIRYNVNADKVTTQYKAID